MFGALNREPSFSDASWRLGGRGTGIGRVLAASPMYCRSQNHRTGGAGEGTSTEAGTHWNTPTAASDPLPCQWTGRLICGLPITSCHVRRGGFCSAAVLSVLILELLKSRSLDYAPCFPFRHEISYIFLLYREYETSAPHFQCAFM